MPVTKGERPTSSWWDQPDSILGIGLFIATTIGVALIVGACVCVHRRRRRKSLALTVDAKCAPTDEESSPALNSCKLIQNVHSLLYSGSLPRHTDLPAPPTPVTHHGNGSAAGSATTLPMRYSPVAPPRFEAQMSRSSQCDRELPPVPPPDGALGETAKAAVEGVGNTPGEMRLAMPVDEEVAELEEEDDSQYDLIARAPSHVAAALRAAAIVPTACPVVGAASSGSLPASAVANRACGRSLASVAGVPRTLTSGTIDSDAGSEVDPLYACIKPSRHSLSRLVSSSLHSTPLHASRTRPEPGHSLEPLHTAVSAVPEHVYSYIRKAVAASHVYQALPRSGAAVSTGSGSGAAVGLGRRSLRGSAESYASLGGSAGAPLIPERGYGQSEVDLVEQLRMATGPSPASSTPIAWRFRRRSQSGVLLRPAAASHSPGPAQAERNGRVDDDRRHSQPALALDDGVMNAAGSDAQAPSSAVREASYQRVTVRESIASLRARNALPQTGGQPSRPGVETNGQQSLSLTDDTSSLYERLDQPHHALRRPPADLSTDFYAEISGDEADMAAYGEGDVLPAICAGLRHSSSGPIRPSAAVLPGSGADRVLTEMREFRHIDSDLDISQTGTPIMVRRGFSRPLSPPPEGMNAIGAHRRSLMTPLMERSIEGSLFDDGSALDGHYTGCYCTSASSEYERLPGRICTPALATPTVSTPEETGPATLARADSPLLTDLMTDSGLGGGSLPVLLPSPPLMRPQRFPAPHPGHHRGHSSSLSNSSAFHSLGGAGGAGGGDSCASSDYCRRDSSSGIASRASQASTSSSGGSPPSSHTGSPFSNNNQAPGFPLTINGNVDRPSRPGRLMSHLLSSLRRNKNKQQPIAVSAASSSLMKEPASRLRTASETSSIL